jgi:hypothetical protein
MSQLSDRIFFSKSDAMALEAQVSIVSLKRKVYKLIESGLEIQLPYVPRFLGVQLMLFHHT